MLLLQIQVTPLRRNPSYAIYYNNWTRLAVLGIIPAALLIYLNYKVHHTYLLEGLLFETTKTSVVVI